MQEDSTSWVEPWPDQATTTFEKLMEYAEKMQGFTPNRKEGLSLSFSQLNLWLTCGRKWEILYKDYGPKEPLTIPLTLGTGFHNTCQAYARHLEATSEVGNEKHWAQVLEDELLKAHEENCGNRQGIAYSEDELVLSYDKLWGSYQAFARAYPGLKGADTLLVDTELYIWHKLKNRLFFEAKLDFVFYNQATDQIIIWDLKTANEAWSLKSKADSQKRLQLLLYKRLLSKVLGVPESKILVYFVVCSFDGQVEPVSFPQDETSVEVAWQEAMQLITGGFTLEDGWKTVRASGQPMTKDKKQCGWCHLKRQVVCPGI
jgi:hypothetical protein